MGEVWLAEQVRPVRRQVAFKVIKAGMDTAVVVARFEAERQAVALMDHPNIAKVFDGGSTPEGRPYFVMEYVRGEPINEYCDRVRMPLPERLELFVALCDGVHHAHQKGIIHRDLKPSNVLVSLLGDRPVPRIIDFGIAKATAQHLTATPLHTEVGAFVGTPEYMSPEQADSSSLDVDTRSDVYSLGIMLYELLSGTLPLDMTSLRARGIDEVRRAIREGEPPRPSARARQPLSMEDDVAKLRATSPKKLVDALRGDLDWIVLKAIQKDPPRRYDSASALGNDIRRFLHHEPVSAGPPSSIYKTRKFVRRHRVGVAAAVALALLCATFITVMAVQTQRIMRERDRADQQAASRQRVVDFLQGLFQVSDPGLARGNAVTAREILDQGVQRIHSQLRDEPETRAELLATMGGVYESLGLYPEAERLERESLGDSLRLYGDRHAVTQALTENLGWTIGQQGRWSEAREWFEHAYDTAKSLFGPDDVRTIRAHNRVGTTLTRLGEHTEALSILEATTRDANRVLGADHPETLSVMNNLAVQYARLNRLPEAIRVDTEVLTLRRGSLGKDHPLTLLSANNLAVRLTSAGNYGEAIRLLDETLPLAMRTWGTSHPDYATLLHSLGEALLAAREFDRAIQVFAEVLADYQRNHHRYLPTLLYEYAEAKAQRGDIQQALSLLNDAFVIGYRPATSPADDPAFAAMKGDHRFRELTSRFDWR